MTTRPLTGSLGTPEITRRPGTGPLANPEKAQPTGPAPHGPKPDANRTRVSLPEIKADGKVQDLIDAQAQLSAKRLELAKKEMELKSAPPHQPSLWDRIKKGVTGATHAAESGLHALKNEVADLEGKVASIAKETAHVVAVGASAVASGAHAAVEGLRDGHGVLGAIDDGVAATGKTLAHEVVNPLLDESPVGKATEFQDKAGELGPILTNRLQMGESASIKVEAGATLPLEALGIPNARIDGGGTVEIKRVPKLDANGQPLTEPKDSLGNPPSELKVTLSLEGRAGAFYSAEVGVQAGVTAGNQTVGLDANAHAEAEAGLEGKVTFTFAFDPQNAKDMGALTGMLQATASTGAASAIPGLGPLLGSAEAAHHAQDFKAFGQHLESMDGSGGLYAQASASAGVDAGMFGALDKNAKTGKRDKAYSETNYEETTMDQFYGTIAGLQGSLGGDVKVGGKVNLRTGDRTVYVEGQGAIAAGANVLAQGKEEGASVNRRLAMTYDKDGQLKSVRVEETLNREQFSGVRTTIEDIYGRPLQPGVVAGLTESDQVRVSYELKPEFRQQLAAKLQGTLGDRASAMNQLQHLALTKDTVQLTPGDVVATSTQAFSLGASMKVSLGAVASVRARLTLASGQDRVLD